MAFDADQAWEYAIFETESGQLVGGIGLHRSDHHECSRLGTGSIPIGPAEGIATAATAVLVDAAFAHLDEATQVVIRMDQANHLSAAVPRKLGFTLGDEEDRDVRAKGHTGRGLRVDSQPLIVVLAQHRLRNVA